MSMCDLENKVITYAGAGHPPVLFWRNATGKASEVVENGLFLGMFPEAAYSSLQLPIAANDRLILYTDGVPKTKNPSDQEFGTARFLKFMDTHPKLAVDHFADGLLDELSRWSEQPRGEGQQDDITVLTVDFKLA